MSHVSLTQFESAEFKPAVRKGASCKNCQIDDWPGMEPKSPLAPGAPRIVIKGGWGPLSRSLSLCLCCAVSEAARLENLAKQIRKAVG